MLELASEFGAIWPGVFLGEIPRRNWKDLEIVPYLFIYIYVNRYNVYIYICIYIMYIYIHYIYNVYIYIMYIYIYNVYIYNVYIYNVYI